MSEEQNQEAKRTKATEPKTKTGFQPGNEWWRKALNPGAPLKVKNAEYLKQKLIEYCEYTDKMVVNVPDVRGKDARNVNIPKPVPYTLAGFCIFMGCNSKYFNELEKNLDLTKKKGRDLSDVIHMMRDIFFTQKFNGTSCGLWNANIIALELGMKARTETTIIHEQPLFADDDDIDQE